MPKCSSKPRQQPRKIIILNQEELECYGGFGTISFEEINSKLEAFQKENIYPEFEVEFRVASIPYGHDGGFDIRLEAFRMETDEEYFIRMKEYEEKQRKKQEAKLERARKKVQDLEKSLK